MIDKYPNDIKPKVGCKVKVRTQGEGSLGALERNTFYKVAYVIHGDPYPGLIVVIPPTSSRKGWQRNKAYFIDYDQYESGTTFWHVYPCDIAEVKQYESVNAHLP